MRLPIALAASLLMGCTETPDKVTLSTFDFPAQLQGTWDVEGSECGEGSLTKIEIEEDEIHEANTTGKVIDADVIGFAFEPLIRFSRAGETWEERVTFIPHASPIIREEFEPLPPGAYILADGGEALEMMDGENDDAKLVRRVRCEG